MPWASLAIVFFASCLHVGWNALAKKARDPLLFIWSATGLGSIVLSPWAVQCVASGQINASHLPFLVITAVVHAAYFITLGRAYRLGDLSLVYPIARGGSVALVAIFAWPLLNESPSWIGAGSIMTILVGVTLVAWKQRRALSLHSIPPSQRRQSLLWALLTSTLIATYSLNDKIGVHKVDPMAYVILMSFGAWLTLLPWIAWQHRRALKHEWQRNTKAIAIAAVFNLSSYALVLYAMRFSHASYVVASREISIVLAVFLGRLGLGEQPSMTRMLGALTIAAGILSLRLA